MMKLKLAVEKSKAKKWIMLQEKAVCLLESSNNDSVTTTWNKNHDDLCHHPNIFIAKSRFWIWCNFPCFIKAPCFDAMSLRIIRGLLNWATIQSASLEHTSQYSCSVEYYGPWKRWSLPGFSGPFGEFRLPCRAGLLEILPTGDLDFGIIPFLWELLGFSVGSWGPFLIFVFLT